MGKHQNDLIFFLELEAIIQRPLYLIDIAVLAVKSYFLDLMQPTGFKVILIC